MSHTYRLERTQFIPRTRDDVFAFFADAKNLERITPEFLQFRILTPLPIDMKAGALIDYQIRLFGIPLRWRTLIETFEPGKSFTDVQLKGPYKRWHHRHEFVEVAGGIQMRDIVDYEIPLGPLGTLAHGIFVGRTLEQIFDHRKKVVQEFFQ